MEKNIKDYLHLYLGCEVECITDMPKDYGWTNGMRIKMDRDIFWDMHEPVYDKGNIIAYWYQYFKLILSPLNDMTEKEMLHVAKLDGYEVDMKLNDEDGADTVRNKLIEARFFKKGEPDPQEVFDPIEEDCIGFKTTMFHGIKEGFGEVWSEPTWDTFWNWNTGLSKETWLFLLSKHFDLFGLIKAGLAIDKTTIKK